MHWRGTKMFNKIPNILYDVDLTNKPVLVKNIFRSAHTIDSYRKNPNFYYYHTLKQHETIEDLAEYYYENARLSWVILLYNEIRDIYSELPRDHNTFLRYVESKYYPENVLNFERIQSLPRVPLNGQYDGELIYAKDTNKSLQWNSSSIGWVDVGMGVPTPAPQTYTVEPNSPDNATGWMVSGKNLLRTKNPQLTLTKGVTYKFNVYGSSNQSFYITTDADVNSDGSLKNWKPDYSYGKYNVGVVNDPIIDVNGNEIGQTLTFTVPKNVPNRLYYNSTSSPTMRGIISLKDIKIDSYVQTNDISSLQRSNGRVMGKIAKVEDDFYCWNGKYFENNVDSFISGWDLLPRGIRELTMKISNMTPHKFTHIIDEYEISSQTYSLMTPDKRDAFVMQSKYEYEEELNEKNRRIKIMKPALLQDFLKDWEKVVK